MEACVFNLPLQDYFCFIVNFSSFSSFTLPETSLLGSHMCKCFTPVVNVFFFPPINVHLSIIRNQTPQIICICIKMKERQDKTSNVFQTTGTNKKKNVPRPFEKKKCEGLLLYNQWKCHNIHSNFCTHNKSKMLSRHNHSQLYSH